MDFATPLGPVLLFTTGSLAQVFSDNLTAQTEKGKHERKRQGSYNGLLPFGTTKGSQGNGCDEPSFFSEVVEARRADVLAESAAPGPLQARLLEAWRRSRPPIPSPVAGRAAPYRKLRRLKEAYLEGEIDRAGYHARTGALAERLAALLAQAREGAEVGPRFAGYPASVADARRRAVPAKRNKLAREAFNWVIVSNGTAVAVVPRPELRPFLTVLSTR